MLVRCVAGLGAQSLPAGLFVEQPLGTIPPSAIDVRTTPDGRRISFVHEEQGKSVVYIDGKPGPAYEAIGPIPLRNERKQLAAGMPRARERQGLARLRTVVFSWDNRRVAYQASRNGRELVVLDGQEGPPFDDVEQIAFTVDSKSLVYYATRGADRFIVVDDLILKADEKSFFFVTRHHLLITVPKGNRRIAIIDGHAGPEFDEIRASRGGGTLFDFSRDGEQIVYSGRRGDQWVTVVNGKEQAGFGPICTGAVRFSSDLKRMAYPVDVGDQQAMVVDGKIGPAFQRIDSNGAVFSPDGMHVAYIGINGHEESVVIDGKVGQAHKQIRPGPDTNTNRSSGVVFSPMENAFCYLVADERMGFVVNGEIKATYDSASDLQLTPDGTKVVYVARRGQKEFVVVNGNEGAAYDSVMRPVVLEGSRLAYIAMKRPKDVVVIDDRESKPYDAVNRHGERPALAPDQKSVAFIATDGSEHALLVNDQEFSKYDSVGFQTFSPNGQRIAFRAGVGEKYRLVVDGWESRLSDQIGDAVFSRDSGSFAA